MILNVEFNFVVSHAQRQCKFFTERNLILHEYADAGHDFSLVEYQRPKNARIVVEPLAVIILAIDVRADDQVVRPAPQFAAVGISRAATNKKTIKLHGATAHKWQHVGEIAPHVVISQPDLMALAERFLITQADTLLIQSLA